MTDPLDRRAPRESSEAYRRLLERLDAWAAEARERSPGVIPCRAGCSACCHGPFDISVADAELVRDAVEGLPEETRAAARQRAEQSMERLRALAPDWTAPYDVADLGDIQFDEMVASLATEPCPMLDRSGSCLIYADRPLVCRLIGLSMITPIGRLIENSCPIQSQFPAYAALPPQPFDLECLELVELEALQGAARRLFGTTDRLDYETTVASAALLPPSK
ncbi:MAG TPA: YkgJ family cysteine cluster protein [Gemmatimonadales bacterium]|nr:YkgJ family cysteine cluster protein [Gemmatimonadales bacterium]